ncbi:MAG: lysophospholipid acyltransferase family protein [Acidobacteriota bacterium]
MGLDARERRAVARWRPRSTWINRRLAWLVITGSQWVMTRRNRLEVDGKERLDALQERGDRGLLTYSNHVSRLDDPLLISNLGLADLPYDRMRWVSADALKLFDTTLSAYIFSAGKCVPTVRGGGLDQPALEFLSDRLQQGEWVHIFPEGGANRDPEPHLRQPFKAGIGRLIDQARPLTLPFFHLGMEHVAPHRKGPQRGHRVKVLFGEATDCDDAFVDALGGAADDQRADSQRTRWDAISHWAYGVLAELESRIEGHRSSER